MTPTKDPAESVVVEFDFTGELASINSVAVSVAVHGSGSDANVASMLVGPAQISGTTVLQRVQAGVHGLDYKLRAVATAQDDVIVRAGVIAVRSA